MKSVTITINQYEIGDVVDVSKVVCRTNQKKNSMRDAMRGMVVWLNPLLSGESSYVVLLDTHHTVLITPEEQGGMKYIGHTDISMLYNK